MRRLLSIGLLASVWATTGPCATAEELDAGVVEFHIPVDTDSGPWNTRETLVSVRVGEVLRLINDDTVVHRLHTDGTPCAHTPDILPGTFYDCTIRHPYDSLRQGPLFDHYVGPTAAFWIVSTAD
jgi:hypothetical protein